MEHFECFCPRMVANAARAIGLGLGALPAQEPPPLCAFDPDTGRLAITTPRYSTAILPDNRGALPYGGIDPARLFGPDQTAAANVGGTPPDAFGVVVSDRRGREVLASQHTRAGAHALRVTRCGRTIPPRPRAYPPLPYAGIFTRVDAGGAVRRHGLAITARHRFRPQTIVSRWTVSCTRRPCRDDVAAANFPTYGPLAAIDVTLRSGRRIRLAGRDALPPAAVPLGDVATVRLQSDPSGGYRLIPLGSLPHAVLVVTDPVSQWTDPLAGPTLTVRWTGRLGSGERRLAVRLIPVG
jgi:hypothetical protein